MIRDYEDVDPKEVNCTIFLGFTSNMVSCGVRETLRYLAEHNLVSHSPLPFARFMSHPIRSNPSIQVSCMVTTCGAVEEDIMKCLNPTYMGSFQLRGKELRQKGLNRIGNTIVPNKNYCDFEDWIQPILAQMLKEQREENTIWSPSAMIRRFGREINNPESIWYWCYKVGSDSSLASSPRLVPGLFQLPILCSCPSRTTSLSSAQRSSMERSGTCYISRATGNRG